MGKSLQVPTSLVACHNYLFDPLIFTLYIKDFNSSMKDLKFIHFADDSTLYAEDKSPSSLAAKINIELKNLSSGVKLMDYR